MLAAYLIQLGPCLERAGATSEQSALCAIQQRWRFGFNLLAIKHTGDRFVFNTKV